MSLLREADERFSFGSPTLCVCLCVYVDIVKHKRDLWFFENSFLLTVDHHSHGSILNGRLCEDK